MKQILTATTACAMVLSPFTAFAAECTNTAWNNVMQSGTLTVGVKADYKPWGYRDTNGDIIGLEPDLAQDVADTLGVELELVPVQSSNRMQFLEQGRIDLMIATMSDREDRRAIVGIPQPNYYSSGTNIIAPKALALTEWSQLEGRPVCGIQGAFYNKIVEERYGATIVAFGGASEAKQALQDKKCVAFVYDDSSLMTTLAGDGWEDFEMPLVTEDDNPWGLAVTHDEVNCVWGRFMSGMIYNWHKDGTIADLEVKWGIQPTPFVTAQSDRFADWLAQ